MRTKLENKGVESTIMISAQIKIVKQVFLAERIAA